MHSSDRRVLFVIQKVKMLRMNKSKTWTDAYVDNIYARPSLIQYSIHLVKA